MLKVKIEIQGKGETEIECESFDLVEAVSIINGDKTDEIGNRLSGFMIGDKNYFRALEVVSIQVV